MAPHHQPDMPCKRQLPCLVYDNRSDHVLESQETLDMKLHYQPPVLALLAELLASLARSIPQLQKAVQNCRHFMKLLKASVDIPCHVINFR